MGADKWGVGAMRGPQRRRKRMSNESLGGRLESYNSNDLATHQSSTYPTAPFLCISLFLLYNWLDISMGARAMLQL
jgi:hypothetical protein